MRHLILAAMAALSLSAWADQYRVIAPVPDTEDGYQVTLTDFDNGATLDSALVADGSVTFRGSVDEPFVARLVGQDGRRLGTFIVEQGTMALNPAKKRAVGTMLNDRLVQSDTDTEAVIAKLQGAESQEQAQSIIDSYSRELIALADEYEDTPLGYLLFIENYDIMEPAQIKEYVAQHPYLSQYQRVQRLLDAIAVREATSVGQPFVDFTVTYDGKTTRLSDYVGHGKYVLVDFFASWCGPCMRELPVIKEIYNTYHDKGLDVLGVAVWDKPEDTLRCISQRKLPWPCMIDCQSIPTDAYGISGVPCIIIFGPDGTIVSRDARGDDLKAIVASLFN